MTLDQQRAFAIAKARMAAANAGQGDKSATPWENDAIVDPWAQFPDAPATAPASDEIPRDNPMVAQPPAPDTTPDPTAGMTWDQKIAHHLAAGSQAALRGVADVAGAPVDLPGALINLTNWGLNKTVGKVLGGPEVPSPVTFSAADTIANLFSKGATALGVPPLTATR